MITAYLVLKKLLPFKKVYKQGINDIKIIDIKLALKLGFRIKMLGILKIHEEAIDIRVHPALVVENSPFTLTAKSPFALTENEYNNILIKSNHLGDAYFYGQGAGSIPTAHAVVNNIRSIVLAMTNASATKNRVPIHKDTPNYNSPDKILSPEKIISHYYVRLSLDEDSPDKHKQISAMFQAANIDRIKGYKQKDDTTSHLHLGMITEPIDFNHLHKVLVEIEKLSFILCQPVWYRVETLSS